MTDGERIASLEARVEALVASVQALERENAALRRSVVELLAFRETLAHVAFVGLVLLPLLVAVAVEAGRGHLDVTGTAAAVVTILSVLGYAKGRTKTKKGADHGS